MGFKSNKSRVLGVFTLAMITAVSVDSIRNLPATALFGTSLLFFFVFASIFFLLPSAFVAAELASTSNDTGGVYVWVRNAFGNQVGVFAIWFQWIENVVWYPTILSFVAATIGFLVSPSLAMNKTFLIVVILVAFWGSTLINWMGIKSSARFSNFCAWFGLIIPMALIIAFGIAWVVTGKPMQLHFTRENLLPNLGNTDVWVSLTAIILSFCGMEIAAVHDKDVKSPQHAYPRAMLIATLLIVITLLAGAWSIAAVLPEKQISLVAGIMQAFNAFFSADHVHWLLPIIAVMLVIGGMGGVSNWIIAPLRGLLFAAQDGNIPKHFSHENRLGSPGLLLLYQAIIVTIITMAFLLMPTVNASYWLLTALAAQLYMLMYILMFAAGIRLRYLQHNQRTGYRIPFGNVGMWVVGLAGIIGSIVTLIIGFVPPFGIRIGSDFRYELLLVLGLVILSVPPFFLYWWAKRENSSSTSA